PTKACSQAGCPPTRQPVSSGTTHSDWPTDWQMPSQTGPQRAAARRTVWTLPPRLSGTPKRLSRHRVTMPCESRPCLLSWTPAAWASGPSWAAGGAEGVGRLQGMAPLNTALALTALADVNVELLADGRARDLDLELLGDVRRVERAAAVGA